MYSRSLKNDQYPSVDLKYRTPKVYKESRTMILVFLEAPVLGCRAWGGLTQTPTHWLLAGNKGVQSVSNP